MASSPGSDHEPLLPGRGATPLSAPRSAPPSRARSRTAPPLHFEAPGERGDRWRTAAHHALALQRMAGMARAAGVLPGHDVKRDGGEYAHIYAHVKAQAEITLVDYCRDHADVVAGLTNSDVPALLDRPRPEWAKVRWINVQGMDWQVFSQIARRYDLHPLAVEDTMHVPQRIKADFYENHVFVSIARFAIKSTSSLGGAAAAPHASRRSTRDASGGGAPGDIAVSMPSACAGDLGGIAAALGGGGGGGGGSSGGGGAPHDVHPSLSIALKTADVGLRGPPSRRAGAGWLPGRGVREGQAVGTVLPMELAVQQVSIFLMRDGTLVSVFHGAANDICRPIVERLQGLKTLITDSEDASFLANVLIDQIVDSTMPMVQTYAQRIAALETRVLTEPRPRAEYTKELHLLSNDCTALRRALFPAQQLISKLQSSPAAAGSAQVAGHPHAPLLSPLTRVYLSDVLDHVDTLVEDMEALALQAKELIELIFNSISHQSNSSMQMLSIINTVFLPLTFLAGVFGTNFTSVTAYTWPRGFWMFWGLCALVTVAFTVLLRRWGMFHA